MKKLFKKGKLSITEFILPILVFLGVFIATSSYVKHSQASPNENANVFIGTGFEWCMELGYGNEYLCDMFYGTFANDKVVMKWSDEWEKGEAEYWANPPYNKAWVIESWNGNVKDGSGYSQYWKYRWDEGCATTHTPSATGGYCWGSAPFIILMERWKVPYSPYPWWTWQYIDGKWYNHAAPAGVGK